MLRVHSADLHEHVAAEIGECLSSGIFTDLQINCKDGEILYAHRVVLSAVSPFLRTLIKDSSMHGEDICVDLSHHTKTDLENLLSLIYSGSIDATVEEIKRVILLSQSLYIPVPVSDQLISILGIEVAKTSQPPLLLGSGQKAAINPGTLSMLQQQIMDQYAIINNLVATSKLTDTPTQDLKAKQNEFLYAEATRNNGSVVNSGSMHPAFAQQDDVKASTANRLNEIINSSYNKSSNLYQCTICNSTYNHPGNFKQHMLKHEREARNRLERGSEANHLNSVLQSAFADRVDNGDPSKVYVCHECNRTFKHPGNYKQHMASHSRPVLSSLPPYKLPQLQVNKPEMILKQRALVINEVTKIKRELPGLVKVEPGADVNEAIRKSIETDNSPLNCPECNISFKTDTLLKEHMKNEHDIEMIIPAAATNNQNDELNKNMEDNLDDDEISGGLEIMETEESLEEENSLDPTKALISCDVPGCYQSFTTTGWLARHKAKMHPTLVDELGPSIFSCTQCGKEFNKMSKLSQHVKTHSPDSHYRYPCDICGKKFTRPQHVNRHKLLHTGEKPFACTTCGKAFTREDKLKHHTKVGCVGMEILGHNIESDDMRENILITDSNDRE